MSDDFDGLFEGLAEFFGELISMVDLGSSSSTAAAGSSLAAAPAKAVVLTTEVPPPNPKYPEGAKYRVRGNDWYHDLTTDDVVVVIYSTSLEVLFKHPRDGNFTVTMATIDDFEEVTDDSSTA